MKAEAEKAAALALAAELKAAAEAKAAEKKLAAERAAAEEARLAAELEEAKKLDKNSAEYKRVRAEFIEKTVDKRLQALEQGFAEQAAQETEAF